MVFQNMRTEPGAERKRAEQMAQNPCYRNGEGYIDTTAGTAIRNMVRDGRKGGHWNNMAKRNCRRTQDETRIHEKAVKMRKMTDEQLVHYVEDRVEKARSEGFNHGKKTAAPPAINLTEIMDELADVKGIGAVKMKQIRIILENRLGGYAK